MAVYVVEESQYGNLLLVAERVYVSSGEVFRVKRGFACFRLPAQTCVDLSELSVAHLLLGHEVYGLVAVAIVTTRELGIIAELI